MAAKTLKSNCQHLILYDGLCGLCNSTNQVILRRDKSNLFCFASLQSNVADKLLRKSELSSSDSETVIVIENFKSADMRIHTKSQAALFIACRIGWPYLALSIFRVFPKKFADWLYDIISRNRYRISQRYDQCPLPGASVKHRFIDVNELEKKND